MYYDAMKPTRNVYLKHSFSLWKAKKRCSCMSGLLMCNVPSMNSPYSVVLLLSEQPIENRNNHLFWHHNIDINMTHKRK